MAAHLISIRLDRKTKSSLERLARRKGVTRSDVLRQAVAQFLAQESAGVTEDGRDAWARYIGCIDGPGNLSDRTGEKFTRLLRERARGRKRP